MAELLPTEKEVGLRAEIQHSLNRFSAENRSDTPDFVLASFLISCLNAFDVAVNRREQYYGRQEAYGPKPDDVSGGDGR